ncbi:hypothetical protein V6N12_076336 [Hibiscus sabdariffa]|uniref:Uncharacterized protein n=1 Tax=Hibiscus sabdariffa TaxID=183260 RepID=A0ABR2DAF0_9ROSI
MMAGPLSSPETLKTLAETEAELNDLIDKDEAYWSQRSRVQWLREGDRNTEFFHARVTGRRKKNWIKGLTTSDGHWCSKLSELHRVAVDYFEGLFTSGECGLATSILDCIHPSITEEMNATLLAPFAADEPITCGDFMIPSYNGWDIARVREVFTPNDAEQILNYPVANRCSDLLVWGNHSSGTYSTRSGYN